MDEKRKAVEEADARDAEPEEEDSEAREQLRKTNERL